MFYLAVKTLNPLAFFLLTFFHYVHPFLFYFNILLLKLLALSVKQRRVCLTLTPLHKEEKQQM